jgi:hypothetical protein
VNQKYSLKEGVSGSGRAIFARREIQDLGDHTGFRLNRCAPLIYGVNSIVAVPMEE